MTYSNNKITCSQKGISLIEILLALAILGVIGFYFSGMINLVDQGDRTDRCLARMNEIADQLKEFYRGRQNLPDPSENAALEAILANAGEVPVQQLNLAQKYRLDTWGQHFLYARPVKQDGRGREITDIAGFKVDGLVVAGVLITLGPNQLPDYNFDETVSPPEFTTSGDDMLLPITLEKEAFEIAMEALEVLDKRVSAYDRHFAGIDNRDLPNTPIDNLKTSYEHTAPVPPLPYPPYPNPIVSDPEAPGYHPDREDFLRSENYLLIDADGCVPAITDAGPICIPAPPANTLANDPNCGRASIDACPNSLDALNRILNIYRLGDIYAIDPWGNPYQWGNSASFGNEDRRYHLFFSMGPDGEANTLDDITPY